MVDILDIDNKIKEMFCKEEQDLDQLKNKLKELELTQEKGIPYKLQSEVKNTIKILKDVIYDIQNKNKYNFYICETTMLIEKYKQLLLQPIKISFRNTTSKQNNETEGEKKKIIKEYVNIAKKYYPIINSYIPQKDTKNTIWCDCSGTKTDLFDMIEDTIYVCKLCGRQQETFGETISCKDVDRVNMSIKYSYDRKIHFRDCINQYQAKQNSTIEDHVFNDIFQECVNHEIVQKPSADYIEIMKIEKEKRHKLCSSITKNHIGMFLKELGHSKHYENVNLIHYVLTGIKPDDISYLEDKLLNDFDLLLEVYDKKFKNKITRSNFINTHYVLYQFLRRYNHSCKKEDFVMLKTVERQNFHDDVTKECFQELNWNHYPMF